MVAMRRLSLAVLRGSGKIVSNALQYLRDRLFGTRQVASRIRGGSSVPLREIDRQLIDRCLRKEPGAWNDFVDRYMGLIYHVIHHVAHARSIVLSPADIEDIAAEIFLEI